MKPDFKKMGDILPVVIQHAYSRQVLMLGYMNQEAYEKTCSENIVTFFSRSKNRLWTKGETSGNFLFVKEILIDCDADALLILVEPKGVVCHTGSFSCFADKHSEGFLHELEHIIQCRREQPEENSYTNELFRKGIAKIAQKVGEEAVEVVIEAMQENDENFHNEAADLLYHLLVLIQSKNMNLADVENILLQRHQRSN